MQLQIDVWGYGDRDVVPRRVFIGRAKDRRPGDRRVRYRAARHRPEGEPGSLVGFAMALPGISGGRPYLHSHMLAVNPDYRNQGIGRRLKLFQRDEALARGIGRMEWTFDPLEIKNSFPQYRQAGSGRSPLRTKFLWCILVSTARPGSYRSTLRGMVVGE